jgi:hypothetical protein
LHSPDNLYISTLVLPLAAQLHNVSGKRAKREAVDPSPVKRMASPENDETKLDNETRSTAQPKERQCSPPPPVDLAQCPPQEEDAPQSLNPIANQGSDIVACDVKPEGFVLLPPPGHELTSSNMTTLNQETHPVS